MLVFVIPLKSQQVAKSWKNVSQLFERCLRSICEQTDTNFRVVVVCHEKPDIKFNHPHVNYVEVDFPIPDRNILQQRQDKGKKIIKGLMYARHFSPTHVMIVDADDCLSGRIAEFTNQHPNVNGWYLNKGYVYQEKSAFIYYRKSHFHSWCGTCNILKFDTCNLPSKDDDYPEDLVNLYIAHKKLPEFMIKKGLVIEELPFIGAVYIIGNGENIYQKGFSSIHNENKNKIFFLLKEALKFRPINSSIRKEFGVYQLS
ncbi:glycosyltransferase family A protein [Nostoc parmelioides]|uniref:Glycosyltransferase family 2 protein n=1 Tax=Nostoc parmelioides FACHB-3921 TaxID=2692909 RepID=A0ABR8BHK7_9NOSO|nr:glycosyltransferase family A protein [Nostoc parmelioides]MBD2253164.1 glycosyltransferase family 2 protein [Nostoc parmelioides FACHB-3921]